MFLYRYRYSFQRLCSNFKYISYSSYCDYLPNYNIHKDTLYERSLPRLILANFQQKNDVEQGIIFFREICKQRIVPFQQEYAEFLLYVSLRRGLDVMMELLLEMKAKDELLEYMMDHYINKNRNIKVAKTFLLELHRYDVNIDFKIHWMFILHYCTKSKLIELEEYFKLFPYLKYYIQFLIPYIRLLLEKKQYTKAKKLITNIPKEDSSLYRNFKIEILVITNNNWDTMLQLLKDSKPSTFTIISILLFYHSSNPIKYKYILDFIVKERIEFNIQILAKLASFFFHNKDCKSAEEILDYGINKHHISMDYSLYSLYYVHYLKFNEYERAEYIKNKYHHAFQGKLKNNILITNISSLQKLISILEK